MSLLNACLLHLTREETDAGSGKQLWRSSDEQETSLTASLPQTRPFSPPSTVHPFFHPQLSSDFEGIALLNAFCISPSSASAGSMRTAVWRSRDVCPFDDYGGRLRRRVWPSSSATSVQAATRCPSHFPVSPYEVRCWLFEVRALLCSSTPRSVPAVSWSATTGATTEVRVGCSQPSRTLLLQRRHYSKRIQQLISCSSQSHEVSRCLRPPCRLRRCLRPRL